AAAGLPALWAQAEAGYQPLVIRYRRQGGDERRWKSAAARGLYELYFEQNLEEKGFHIRKSRFQKFFLTYIPHSAPCYTLEEVEQAAKDCALLICGSDQIWNPAAYDPVYYLDFGSERQRRIAFAASMGITTVQEQHQPVLEQAAKHLKRLDRISVREQAGAEILQAYTQKKVHTVLDPTLHLPAEEWDRLASPRKGKGRYVLCYTLGRLTAGKAAVRRVCEKFGTQRVILIATQNTCRGYDGFGEVLYDVSPEDFISLVKYAEAVCTDSFHGVAFSVIYHKPFCVLERKTEKEWGGGGRIENLLRVYKGAKELEIGK
ncbi:MAG: polysaccharide pyruvyl transferase family protein, partial [Dorea sp.]|nr:polysaccharide pyruvyl transferase family protein [Dorea sp.]